jgi:hypothetical protein
MCAPRSARKILSEIVIEADELGGLACVKIGGN